MKKIFKVVKNIFVVLALIVYFSIIIAVSTLVLSRNDYNFSQFGDKVLILMDEKSGTDKYKANSLIILKTIDIKDIVPGQEIFVYHVDENTKTVQMVIEKVGKVVIEGTQTPYIVLDNLGTSYGESFIAGVAYSSYDDIGKYLSIIESKWVFFALLIVPCFFILIYEIYLLIVSIKYEDFGDEVKVPSNNETTIKQKPANNSKESTISDDMSKQLEDIQDEIFNMKDEIENENIQDENQKKIEELMNQVNKLKEEVNSKEN